MKSYLHITIPRSESKYPKTSMVLFESWLSQLTVLFLIRTHFALHTIF
jgi:hypothetical protein